MKTGKGKLNIYREIIRRRPGAGQILLVSLCAPWWQDCEEKSWKSVIDTEGSGPLGGFFRPTTVQFDSKLVLYTKQTLTEFYLKAQCFKGPFMCRSKTLDISAV